MKFKQVLDFEEKPKFPDGNEISSRIFLDSRITLRIKIISYVYYVKLYTRKCTSLLDFSLILLKC